MKPKSYYAKMSADDMENLQSEFLVSSWSYSKVTAFARNEKYFEMVYVYGERSKSSATLVAGNAYHSALDFYFTCKKDENVTPDVVDLEMKAFDYIDNVGANEWKLQKTVPTVEDCIKKTTTSVTTLLNHFFSELGTYEDDIAEILEVEVYCNEFLTINGVEIPLPCHAKIDLVVKTKGGKTVIIDHKSKSKFTDDEEMAMAIGVQAITYIECYETKTGHQVDEVWFIENKIPNNKDKSPQLHCLKVALNDGTRKLYEALLYEPLKRMIAAVNDPDYLYLINDSDNFVDRAEIYNFWCKTMIAEVEDFNVEAAKKDLISKRLKKIRDASVATVSPTVIKEFKKNASSFIQYDLSSKNMTESEKIEHVLKTFGTSARVAFQFDGYSSNTYLLEMSAGTKINSIYSHRLDIANQLNVSNVRISQSLVVHEGHSYLAVESSKKRTKDLLWDPNELEGLKIPIGKDNFDRTIIWDLENQSTPHMLICGATGSGKSVSVKSTIEYALQAGIDQVTIFDPKYEFKEYIGQAGISVYNDIDDIETVMACLVEDMNGLVRSGKKRMHLVVFDEFADAVTSASSGKLLEQNLRILLQKGRSTGFRIIAATQRASVKVITGDAKVNFPVLICFRVPKEIDSKVVIDEAGAESLAGYGDGLMRSPEYMDIVRFQAFYVNEVKALA